MSTCRIFVAIVSLAALAITGCRTDADVESAIWRVDPAAVVIQRRASPASRIETTVVVTDAAIDCAMAKALLEGIEPSAPQGIELVLTFTMSPWKRGEGRAVSPSVSRYDGRGTHVTSAISYRPAEGDTTNEWFAAELLEAPTKKGDTARLRVAGAAAFLPAPVYNPETDRYVMREGDSPAERFELDGEVPATLCTDIAELR